MANPRQPATASGLRLGKMPFSSELSAARVLKSIEDKSGDQGVLYGRHVRVRMGLWIGFPDNGESAAIVVGHREVDCYRSVIIPFR